MENLNVCLLNDSFPPAIDGVANATFNYAKIINENYGKATVITPQYPNTNDNYDFKVYRYSSFDTTKFVGYRAGIPFDLNLLTTIDNQYFDIIHTHCPVSSTVLARLIRDNIKKPIILTYHTKFDYDIRKAIDNKLLQEVAIKALIANISSVDEVWTVSKGAGENLKSLGYKGDYLVMPNGVDFSKDKPKNEIVREVIQEYHIPPKNNSPTFLFVGRMMWYKGIKLIVDALRDVNKENIDFRMIFVGKGADYDEIVADCKKNGIFDKCIFTGAVIERDKLKAIFSISDLFIFPSVYDTNGIVVREAAAIGLASVLIKNSCAAEDTINNKNCFWINENSTDLAKLIIENKDNIDLYHKIGKNAQEQLYLSWEDAVKTALERYQDVIKEKNNNLNIHKFNITDNLLKIYANLSLGLTKARNLYSDMLDHFEQFE